MEPLTKVDLGGVLPLVTSGKVREVYEVNRNSLLLVCTDRISAFDRIIGVCSFSILRHGDVSMNQYHLYSRAYQFLGRSPKREDPESTLTALGEGLKGRAWRQFAYAFSFDQPS